MKPFLKSIPISKVVDGENGLAVAYGICTSEAVDSENERCNYAASKPEYQKWSQDALKATMSAGQQPSFGNIRIMHTAEVGGKAIGIDFNDVASQIWLKAEAKDAAISDQLRRGIYKSYSHAGKYAWRKCETCKTDIPGNDNYCPSCEKTVIVDYAVKDVAEVSLCDKGANPEANFTYVKANGSMELRKFAEAALGVDPLKTETEVRKEAKTKRVAGEDLHSSAFAYVGDPDRTETWKLPIHFSTEAKTVRHIRNALARVNQTRGIPADEKARVRAKIVAAAKEHGIEVSEDSEKISNYFQSILNAQVEKRGLKKGLYEVSRFADLIQGFSYLWQDAEWELGHEEDESGIPEELKSIIESMADTFLAMAEEELRELTEVKKTAGEPVEKSAAPAANEDKMNEELLKAARKGMAGFCKGMCKVHKAKADAHEKASASHAEFAESHKDMVEHHQKMHKMHKALVGVNEAPEDSKTEHELHTQHAEHHMLKAAHHKVAHGHHLMKAKHHEKMAAAHHAAHGHYENMAAAHEDGDGAKAAQGLLEKMALPEVTAPPNVADIVAQMIAATAEAHKAQIAELSKAFADQTKTLTEQITVLKEEVQKKVDPPVPGKLQLIPRPGTDVKKTGTDNVPIESGAIGF